LGFDEAELVKLGDTHDRLGDDVASACKPDVDMLGSVRAYGAAGAVFAVAVNAYVARLDTAGQQLSSRYHNQGSAIRAAGQNLNATDRANAGRFGTPR
jgi:hypothetical protein